MIRKAIMLAAVSLLFAYTVWIFYSRALAFNPLAAVSVQKATPRPTEKKPPAPYQQAWTESIHEKNVFSPTRTYREPKAQAAAVQKPKRPEFALKGIILDRYGEFVAYIVIDKGRPVAMRKGEKTADVELVDVSDKRAVLKWYDETIDLTMEKITTIDNAKGTK